MFISDLLPSSHLRVSPEIVWLCSFTKFSLYFRCKHESLVGSLYHFSCKCELTAEKYYRFYEFISMKPQAHGTPWLHSVGTKSALGKVSDFLHRAFWWILQVGRSWLEIYRQKLSKRSSSTWISGRLSDVNQCVSTGTRLHAAMLYGGRTVPKFGWSTAMRTRSWASKSCLHRSFANQADTQSVTRRSVVHGTKSSGLFKSAMCKFSWLQR